MNKSDLALMDTEDKNVVLFHPYIPEEAIDEIADTLKTRWIGQGPKVDKFEKVFSERFNCRSIAVGSCTDALHLAYILADIKQGDEVIAPLFSCSATNEPLLYQGAKIKFADIDPKTMNINIDHVKYLINSSTKAIVCVDYGGLPCNLDELKEIADYWNIPIIEDCAQAMGATYKGKSIGSISDYSCFSFQAIKHITTGDGGMLTFNSTISDDIIDKAKRIRWFGIDRKAKQGGIWNNDIKEVGYKYQMTDISASLGLASMKHFDELLTYRRELLNLYYEGLKNIPGLIFVGGDLKDRENAAWLCTIIVENRRNLQMKLREHNIESNQVHFRNDIYSIFKDYKTDCPNMDSIEDKYLVLPLHHKVKKEDVEKICYLIKEGW